MSMRQVLNTTLAAAQDGTVGVAANVAKLVLAGAPNVAGTFEFVKWARRQPMKRATTYSIVVRPGAGGDEVKTDPNQTRDGTQQISVDFECFGADLGALQDTIAVVQNALMMTIDALVDYARVNGGTIYEIARAVETTYGEYEGTGSGTNAGFTSRFTVYERSSQ